MLALLTLAGAAYVVAFCDNTAGPADNAGYLNLAQTLSRLQLLEAIRPIPGVDTGSYSAMCFTPVGHRPGPRRGTLAPVYSVGFPLHVALAGAVVGLDRGVVATNALAFLCVVPALFLLGRRLELPASWSLAGVVLFATFPVTMLHYTRVMSDGVAATWSVAAFLLALESRTRPRLAALSGVAFAVAVLVRPTNLLLLPGLLLALGWRLRALGFFVAGGLPLGVALGLYNHALYGRVLTTGYPSMGATFQLDHLGPAAWFIGSNLVRFLSPLFALLVALGLVLAGRGDRRQQLLAAWWIPVVALYALYEHTLTGSWWRLRFLLPVLPALLLAALLAARTLHAWAQARWGASVPCRRLVALALALGLVWPLGASVHRVVSDRLWNAVRAAEHYRTTMLTMDSVIEPDAVVMASGLCGSVFYYTRHPLLRYDIINARDFDRFRRETRAAGVPVYAVLLNGELGAHAARYPGMFTLVGRRPGVSLWRLGPAAPAGAATTAPTTPPRG